MSLEERSLGIITDSRNEKGQTEVNFAEYDSVRDSNSLLFLNGLLKMNVTIPLSRVNKLKRLAEQTRQ